MSGSGDDARARGGGFTALDAIARQLDGTTRGFSGLGEARLTGCTLVDGTLLSDGASQSIVTFEAGLLIGPLGVGQRLFHRELCIFVTSAAQRDLLVGNLDESCWIARKLRRDHRRLDVTRFDVSSGWTSGKRRQDKQPKGRGTARSHG